MILKVLTVVAMSTFEIYAAIGTAHAFGLSTWTILFSTLTGGIAGVFIAGFLGNKIELWIQKNIRRRKKPKPKTGMIYKIWDKYGLYGIGLLGTFLLGAPIAIGVGVGFNASMKKLIPICLFSVVLRCFVFTFFSAYIKNLFY